NPILDAIAAEGIRIMTARTERVAVGIADGYTRATFGRRNGVSLVQSGPGCENAFSAVAQAYGDSVPVFFMPAGASRRELKPPNFVAARSYREISKWVDMVLFADQIPNLMRRAFTLLRTGRPGPVVLEVPRDVALETFDETLFRYQPVKGWRTAGDPSDVRKAARMLMAAENPVIRAGSGVLFAEAWNELRELSELLSIPVFTTMQGKGAFPENHALSLGTGGRTRPKMVMDFLNKADLIFAIGSSCTIEPFTTNLPQGKPLIQSTIDERDIGKDYPVEGAVIGDAGLVLRQLINEIKEQAGSSGRITRPDVERDVRDSKEAWLKEWLPKLTSDDVPINPYRVIWDLNRSLDKEMTIVSPESGGPRDQSIPFYEATEPGGFIGWGKMTTLGGSLGFSMGAKLAHPDKTVVHILGDASMGMAGMDFETAVREKIPILSIVLNNGIFSGYDKMQPEATKRYNIDRCGGDYTRVAEGLGFHAEKIDQPGEIIPAIERAKKVVANGQPALLEFLTRADTDFSLYET
ncbi:MAG: thiamine pyrophosphate-requiring protein, partial [Deltaproteobacteria bacterium]|nr:thiamine pyrophosphate-requiring protein [Deltaproteobacteria bacterium]